MYLFNSTLSYFFSYKKSVLITHQKTFIVSWINIIFSIVQNILQIIFLLITHNFIVYLAFQVFSTVGSNIVISIYVDKNYPFIKKYRNIRIDRETKVIIFNNIKAMFFSKISSVIVTSTDNLLISKFVSTVILGLYSNYTIFTTMLRSVMAQIFNALVGSVGNLVALESSETVYKTYKKIWFINFWLASFCCVTLYVLVNPFIELWVGDSYVISSYIPIIICLNLYLRLMRNTFLIFIDTYGLFSEVKLKCVLEAVINFIVSLFLVKVIDLGIYGILIGTLVSNVFTNLWYEPYILYVQKWKISLKNYFFDFSLYLCITVLVSAFMKLIYKILFSIIDGWLAFFILAILCIIIINLVYYIIFSKTLEFKYLTSVVKTKLLKK